MESLRTAFRLVVMIAALAIGYKAWQHYGPPAEQLKSLALRALDVARSALDNGGQSGDGAAALTADPRPVAPSLGVPMPAPLPAGHSPTGQVMQAQALVPVTEFTATPLMPPALAPVPARLPAPDPPSDLPVKDSASVAAGDGAQLKSLYSQLEQLGAHKPQLAAWGSSGQLYRFSCQASLAGAANFNRHFEAVDADPRAAVEAVVAKVSAWRTAQRETAQPGTTLR